MATNILDKMSWSSYDNANQRGSHNVILITVKTQKVQHGHGVTALQEAELLPWSEIAIELIGSWTLKSPIKK